MRQISIAIIAALIYGAVSLALHAQETQKPNVLFILCDDLRPDALGCYGSRHVKTPHVDALASEGVRFANTFCTTSLCSPSRASILTGLYAHNHGVLNNFTELPAEHAQWPMRLQECGYETAYVGKWHMGEANDEPRPGFNTFITHKGQGKYFDTEWNINGTGPRVIKGYYTTIVTDMALDFLKSPAAAAKPWALCIGHKAPHSFYFPERKYEHTFDGVRVPYPDTAFHLETQPAWIKERLYTWHGIYGPLFGWRENFPDDRPEAVKDFENMTHAYWGTILSVDDSVGRLVSYLKTTGQLDNTIIVLMGDNGLLNGEHGMVDKRTMHEDSIRIPLVVRYPKLTRTPRVVDKQVLTVDIAPSILDLCGAEPIENIQGRSWVKLVREGDASWRTGWFYEYNYEKQFPYTPNVRGIRTDRFKYIHYPHGDGNPDRHIAELYDLKADPEERYNLIADDQYSETLQGLKDELQNLMSASGLAPSDDKMPLDAGIKKELPDEKIR
jgi:arylsulfatase A-like enzyme